MPSPAPSHQNGTITTPDRRPSLIHFPTASSSTSSTSSSRTLFDFQTPFPDGAASPFTPPSNTISPSVFKQASTNGFFTGTSEAEDSLLHGEDKSNEQNTPSPSPSGRRNLREPREFISAVELKLEPLLLTEYDPEETDLAAYFTTLKLSPERLLNTHQSTDVQSRPLQHKTIGLASSKPNLADDSNSPAVPNRSRKLSSPATIPRFFKSLKSELTHDEYLLVILDDCLCLRDYWGNEPGKNYHHLITYEGLYVTTEEYPPKYRGRHQDNRSLEKYHTPIFIRDTTKSTINEKMRKRILAPLGIKGLIAGWVYILESIRHTPGHIKIGYTGIDNGIEDRRYNLMRACNLPLLEVPDAQQMISKHCYIVEQLAMTELHYCRKKYLCICRDRKTGNYITHGEWFEIDKKKGLEVVQRWRTWVANAFDNEGQLKPFWSTKAGQLTKYAAVNWETWTLPDQSTALGLVQSQA